MGSVDSTDRLDRLFAVLCDPVRRQVLARLYEQGGTDATGMPVADLTSGSDGCHEAALYHTHLPKLAEAGYVDWHHSDCVVSAGDRFDEIEPLLDLLAEHHDELPIEWP